MLSNQQATLKLSPAAAVASQSMGQPTPLKSVVETLLRMQRDIELKQKDLLQRMVQASSLKPLVNSIEYQISSAFDIFFNAFKEL